MEPGAGQAVLASPSPSEITSPDDAPAGGRLIHIGGFSRFTGIGIWLILILIFALWVPSTFLTKANAQSIAANQAITVVLAIGLLPTLSAGVYDLSSAQNLGLAAVISSSLMVNSHVAPPLAVLITLAAGAGIGAMNGLVIAVIGVDSFIATLGMSSVLLALTEKISNDLFIGPLPSSIENVVAHQPLGILIVTIYAFVIAGVVWYVLEHTPIGRRTFATGLNRDAARLTGVRTTRYVFSVCVVTGVVSSLAGVMAAAQFGEVSSTLGPPYLLPGVRRGLPRHHANQTGPVQRVGHDHRPLPDRDRHQGTPARRSPAFG